LNTFKTLKCIYSLYGQNERSTALKYMRYRHVKCSKI
jgi:hypothetical protein